MPLPDFSADGVLPPGIHAASLAEVDARYGQGAPVRQQQINLLHRVVEAALESLTIKRILLWGSFVTARREPQDLDYSLVVSVDHHLTGIATAHRRFLIPSEARQRYGVDTGYLLLVDYPLDLYVERVDFSVIRSCGSVAASWKSAFVGW